MDPDENVNCNPLTKNVARRKQVTKTFHKQFYFHVFNIEFMFLSCHKINEKSLS